MLFCLFNADIVLNLSVHYHIRIVVTLISELSRLTRQQFNLHFNSSITSAKADYVYITCQHTMSGE